MNRSPDPTLALSDWLDAHIAEGPPALIARVREHAMAAPDGGTIPERLSLAAERVLSIVEEHPGDREIALDLLSADALITLALLAQAEFAPGSLARFAAGVLAGERVWVLDLHCHLLPAVDDGSRSVSQSVAVLLAFKSQGVTGVCLTSHLLASESAAGLPELHHAAFRKLTRAAPDGVRLMRGAEIMLDRPMDRVVGRDRAVTLNGSRYVLVEFPRQVAPTTVVDALALVLEIGLVPVVAHPERYSCCAPSRARRWQEMGALLQLDGPTLLMPRTRGHRARELLSHGLCDIIAADNHGDDRSLGPVAEAFREQGGSEQAELLLTANPAALVEDREPEEVAPFALRLPLVERMRKLLGHNKEERG